MDYQKILEQVKDFVKEKGDYVYDHWEEMSVEKLKDDGKDVTTNFDSEIEKAFSQWVDTNYPEHGFRGEEHTELNREGEFTWHVDPIDGTKWFAKKVPMWNVTVALIDQEKNPILGVTYNPVAGQLYSASLGNGAYLNNDRIFVNEEEDLKKLQFAMDMSKMVVEDKYYADLYLPIYQKLLMETYRLRILGNGAYALAWTASGFFGGVIDFMREGEKTVDIGAGLILCKEAGAEIYRWNMDDSDLYSMIVARPEVNRKIRELLEV